MKDDIISLSDETYYHGSAVIMGDSSYMKVIVENSYDVPFWQDFFNSFISNRNIDITPYEYAEGKPSLTDGKAHIYRMSKEGKLGPHYLGCVDADYDYLLSNHTDDGNTLKNAKFIIHTFAYSVENLLCCSKGFNQICTQACKCQSNYPFGQWMNDLANAIYPLLIWALYLDSRDDAHDVFSASDWNKVFPRTRTYTHCDTAPQEIVEEVTNIVNTLISEIEAKVTEEDIGKKNRLGEELVANKALKAQDSLMYVRGHDLFGFVRDMMLKAVCQHEKKKHLEFIDTNAIDSNERINRKNQYLKQVRDPEAFLESNFCYKNYWAFLYNGMIDLYNKSQITS